MMRSLLAAVGAALLLAACNDAPPPPPPPPPPAAAPSYMVFFDWDRSNLSQQALATIHQAAVAFKNNGSPRITAIGHTDTSGPANYNMALSLRRANAVRDALVSEGVPAASITTIGKGEEGLLVPTADGVREPQNRRVEILMAGQVSMVGTGVFADPRSYCKALSDKYRQYRGNTFPQGVEAAAIAKCDAGNYSEGIPTLENALIDAKIPLPSPGYRWPGQPI